MHVHPLEKRWAWIAVGLVVVMIAMVVYTAVAMSIHPPSHVEAIDSNRLHLTKEFAEDNLGVRREGDSLVARIVMARYHVEPPELVLPANTPIVLRAASADVLHGLHVAGTNIGTQVVPGYVSEVHTTISFDAVSKVGVANPDGSVTVPLYCNEYCGLGHHSMWARVRVTPK
ncbi:MAG TPA: cytochrome C oxidase subunit II [Thermoanaerobaculia bacterium]|nr:cytochrome C oxidase subunit II [Thermoanaerobaculia bacterium]